MQRAKFESRSFITLAAAISITAGLLAACTPSPDAGSQTGVTVFHGARVIVGDGSVMEGAAFTVEDGRITALGSLASLSVPRGARDIDLTGTTVIPAIVNAHVHLSSERGERAEQLQHMAYYGAGTVVSLGLDSGDVGFAMRDEIVPDGARSLTAGRGITSSEPGRSEVPYWVTTEEQARAAVRELAAQNVDIVKIWVDDRNGRYEKLSPALYGAVIDEAHKSGLRVTAHVFTLGDAKGLLRAGVDAFAHGVRDMDIDDDLLALWRERPNVVLVPNLPNPGVAVDLSWLAGTVAGETLQEMMMEASIERPDIQEAFGIQARNLARLNSAGVRIAFGTDGSVPWAAQLEMEDMVRSGMTPGQVIAAATGNSAEFMRLTDVGTLAVGKSADFIVLDANPLDNITNARRINAVYLRGATINRQALSAKFKAS